MDGVTGFTIVESDDPIMLESISCKATSGDDGRKIRCLTIEEGEATKDFNLGGVPDTWTMSDLAAKIAETFDEPRVFFTFDDGRFYEDGHEEVQFRWSSKRTTRAS